MRKRWLFTVAAVTAATGAGAASVLAGTASPGVVSATTVGTAAFDAFDITAHTIPADTWQARLRTHGISDAYVVDNTFGAGASTGWHTHPGPSLILVTHGSVVNYSSDQPDCAGQAYTKGQGFIDPGGDDVHELVNPSMTDTAETVAVQLVPQGALRKTPEPEPANCHL
jgi:hypothetical protein